MSRKQTHRAPKGAGSLTANSPELDTVLKLLNGIVREFLTKNPIDQLKHLDERFGSQNRALREMLRDMGAMETKKGNKARLLGDERYTLLEAFACEDGMLLKGLVEAYFLFLYAHPRLSPLGGLFASKQGPRNWESFQRSVLSPFATALLSDGLRPIQVSTRPDPFWNKNGMGEFLSLYNRYTRLIRAARSEAKTLRKRKGQTGHMASPRRLAESEVAEKFGVPKHLTGELFSDKPEPKILAFKWIVETMSARGGRKVHGSVHTHEKMLKLASAEWRRQSREEGLIPIDYMNGVAVLIDRKDKEFGPHLTFQGALGRHLTQKADSDSASLDPGRGDSDQFDLAFDYLYSRYPSATEFVTTISPTGIARFSASHD